MKNTLKISFGLLMATSLFVACKKDFKNPVGDTVFTSGSANFKTYVSLGNSLTSGYADGALYASAQNQSYPVMIANSMNYVVANNFKVPLMPDNIGGFKDYGVPGKYELKVVNGALAPVQTASASNFAALTGMPYQNMGVPGAKVAHLLAPGYGLLNPYFGRFMSSPTTSVIADAVAQNPTFFSLWIGANDVLGYATTGGVNTGQDTITSPTLFATYYEALVNQLTANGAGGVVANIPAITSIPFFTTIPYKFVKLPDANVDALNTAFVSLNQVFAALDPSRTIQYVKGAANSILIKDKGLTSLTPQITAALVAAGRPLAEAQAIGFIYGQCRMSKSGDLILLTASSKIGTIDSSLILAGAPASMAITGLSAPTDALVLDPTEQSNISVATAAYNTSISTIATSKKLAFYDAASDMKLLSATSGMTFNGVNYSAKFVSGGAFSLDGVHPTPRGYAIIANGFLKAINSQYGSNLPLKNPNDFSGVTFP